MFPSDKIIIRCHTKLVKWYFVIMEPRHRPTSWTMFTNSAALGRQLLRQKTETGCLSFRWYPFFVMRMTAMLTKLDLQFPWPNYLHNFFCYMFVWWQVMLLKSTKQLALLVKDVYFHWIFKKTKNRRAEEPEIQSTISQTSWANSCWGWID
jgi:hypothetical protein